MKIEAALRLAEKVNIDHLLSKIPNIPGYKAQLLPSKDGCDMVVDVKGKLPPRTEKAIDDLAFSIAQRLGFRVKDLGSRTNKNGMVILDYIMHDVED